MLRWISGTWCKTMHRQAMWPIHGRYLCPRCLYEHTVSWEQAGISTTVETIRDTAPGAIAIPSAAPLSQPLTH
jgi:hypothetical protein